MSSTAPSDNSGLVAVVILLVLAVAGFLIWWFVFKKTKGKKCDPEDTVVNADEYEYDEDGNCMVSTCLANYSLTDNECIEDVDCEIEWPDTFTLTTDGGGSCYRTAMVINEQSGAGNECPTAMNEYFSATDSNCVSLQSFVNATANPSIDTPDTAGTRLNVLKNQVVPDGTKKDIFYGNLIFSTNILSNGSNVYNNSITPAGTSNIISFAPVSGSEYIAIGTENDVLAVSVPGLDVLKWVSSTELVPVFKYVKDGDYSNPKYDILKFKLSVTQDTPQVLTLTSKSAPTNTFTITGPTLPVNQLMWYTARLPEPVGYNVGEINSFCTSGTRGAQISVSADDLSAARGRLIATTTNPLLSNVVINFGGVVDNPTRIFTAERGTQNALRACSNICDNKSECNSFLFDQSSNGGTCRLYPNNSTPAVAYTGKDTLGGICYNKKSN
jgi:hypothetical protein